MQALEGVRRTPITVDGAVTIADAARVMDAHAVGALVVTDAERPVGIVTDRDIVVRAMARGVPTDSRIDSIMTTDLMTFPASGELRDTIKVFQNHPFRRLPLVDDAGAVVGMLTVDDLFIDLTADLAELARPVTGQVLFGHPEPVATIAIN